MIFLLIEKIKINISQMNVQPKYVNGIEHL